MQTFKLTAISLIFISPLSGIPVFPNPVSPTQFVVLSEVQVVDSTHWTVEFLCKNKFNNMPINSDTFTYQFSLLSHNISPDYHPKIPVNKNGYGLITPQQYPTLRLHPKDTVKLFMDKGGPQDTLYFVWKCVIDSAIKPTQSMAALQWKNYNGLFYIQWCRDASPTLGYENDNDGIFGAFKVFVCNKDNRPFAGIPVSYNYIVPQYLYSFTTSITTDSNGYFDQVNLYSFDSRTFSITGRRFGPFYPEPGCTTSVICKFDSIVDFGTVKGLVCDKDNKPLQNIFVITYWYATSVFQATPDNTSTDNHGYFYQRFKYPGWQGCFQVLNSTFGPYTVDQACTTNVICKLDPSVKYGTVKGFVCNGYNQPLKDTLVISSWRDSSIISTCKLHTDSCGYFYQSLFIPAGQGYYTIGNSKFGPFTVDSGCITNVTCNLDVSQPVRSAPRAPQECSLKILAVSRQQGAGKALIGFTANTSEDYFYVSVFSISGKRLFYQRVVSNGSGTYTVAWNASSGRKIPSGRYIVRISGSNASIEKAFSFK